MQNKPFKTFFSSLYSKNISPDLSNFLHPYVETKIINKNYSSNTEILLRLWENGNGNLKCKLLPEWLITIQLEWSLVVLISSSIYTKLIKDSFHGNICHWKIHVPNDLDHFYNNYELLQLFSCIFTYSLVRHSYHFTSETMSNIIKAAMEKEVIQGEFQ